MNASLKGNEQITQLLNDWYVEIRARRIENAHKLKEEINTKMQTIEEDQNLFIYYSLFNFRYQYLVDSLSISKDSFKQNDSFAIPADNFLAYYYHFFKAIHSNITGSHTIAKMHYEKAEELLKHIPDEIEKAEFYYELAIFYCHTQKYLLTINYLTKAKEVFSSHKGYELKVAFCNNLYGLACTHLKEYELAEEHFLSAIDTFQKEKQDSYILIVRHNLGLMYANQNLSSLAIRYLSEVNQKLTTDYKAIFIQAREHFKLGETNIASNLIEKGLNICNNLCNKGYIHHFTILKLLNDNASTEDLEKIVVEGLSYFEKEELYEYVEEYAEKLALKFYQEDNYSKASKYFYTVSKAKDKNFKKGALK
ncbi:tetratricopeptide repeat protein [Bacillus cytotoxicus]|uniref:Tetratricopeptide domain protein n=1 Tax=Bacillus cytotoxicus TaxID=580165 RepID=A0AAX2CEL2_9BACI|nr:Rap family tetratricopeptide repeat protein [Bacillus cytotoxicus]QTR82954.1 tetratricopeptide repeat protein [Bacillus cytotoxicus]QTR86692.1 tetratricopeptide repeat protein [Bacillus cytotoxicus]SCL87403.1 Tetratricopeptide domain protein [Bacillus cytotoxicus]